MQGVGDGVVGAQVHPGVGGQGDAVVRVGGAFVHVGDGAAQAQAGDGVEVVAALQGGGVQGHVNEAVAFQGLVVGAQHFGVGVAVAGAQVEVAGGVAVHGELGALGAGAALGHFEAGVERVADGHVVFFDDEAGGVDVEAPGGDAHARFVLHALFRVQRLPAGGGALLGHEGFVAAGVERGAVGEVVDQAELGGPGGFPEFGAGDGVAGHEVGGFLGLLRVGVAQAGEQGPLLGEGDAVLDEAGEDAVGLGEATVAGFGAQIHGAVDRFVQVDGVDQEHLGGAGAVGFPVVHAGDKAVGHAGQGGFAAQVEDHFVVGLLGVVAGEDDAVEGAEVRAQAERGVFLKRLVVAGVGVAQAGVDGVGDRLGEPGVQVEGIPLGGGVFPGGVEVVAVVAVGVGLDGPFRRGAAGQGGPFVGGVAAFHGQVGGVGEVHGDVGRHEQALVAPVIHGGVAVLVGQVQARAHPVVERAGHVQGGAVVIVAAVLGAHFRLVVVQRLLGDHVDGAARLHLPVQHRGRALEDFQALHVGQVGGVVGLPEAQAVDGFLRVEATDQEVVGEHVAAGAGAVGAGGEAHHVADGVGLGQREVFPVVDAHALGDGFHGVVLLAAVDGDRFQRVAVGFRRRFQTVAAVHPHGGDAAAGEQRAQGLLRRVVAAQRRRLLAFQQRGVAADRQPGLPGQINHRLVQGLGGQVDGLRRLGLRQGRLDKR